MSTDKQDYEIHRLLGTPVATEEYLHTPLSDFDGSDILNTDGGTGVWIDLHKVYKGDIDWDGVWNSHVREVGDRFFQNSVRISRLFDSLGVEDPESNVSPTGSGAQSATPWMVSNLGTSTYPSVLPDGSGKVSAVVDGMSAITAISQLEGQIGTRSFTEEVTDGFTWEDFQSRDGWYLDHTTTITHNLDQIDKLIGKPPGFTGFTGYGSSGFWNAKDIGEDIWSLSQQDEQLNRAIGSREVPNSAWFISTIADELSTLVKTGFNDDESTVTDYLNGLVDALGDRDTPNDSSLIPILTSGTASSVAPQWVLQSNETKTYVTLLRELSDGISNRIITDQGYSYVLDAKSGNTVTQWVNTINQEIGTRVISSTSDFFPLEASTGSTITSWANTLNDSIGDRVVTDSTANHILSTSGQTITNYLNLLNTEIGDRNIANTTDEFVLKASTGGTLTEWANSLNNELGDRIITNKASNYILQGSTDGLTFTSYIDTINTEIGDRNIAGTTGSFPLAGSSGNTLTEWVNTINNTFGDRVISNKTASYILEGSTDGLTITDYINTINNEIGDRIYTNYTALNTIAGDGYKTDGQAQTGNVFSTTIEDLNRAINTRNYTNGMVPAVGTLSDDENITASLEAINAVIGNRTISAPHLVASSGFIYQGLDFQTDGYTSLSTSKGSVDDITTFLNRTVEQIGDRQYTSTYLVDSDVLSNSIEDMGVRLDEIDTNLGLANGDTSFTGQLSSTAEKYVFPAGAPLTPDLIDMLNGIGDNSLINVADYPLTSTEVDVNDEPVITLGVEQRSTSGWFDNSSATTTRDILQQIIDKIDGNIGYGK